MRRSQTDRPRNERPDPRSEVRYDLKTTLVFRKPAQNMRPADILIVLEGPAAEILDDLLPLIRSFAKEKKWIEI
jgi:hypothetical protein